MVSSEVNVIERVAETLGERAPGGLDGASAMLRFDETREA